MQYRHGDVLLTRVDELPKGKHTKRDSLVIMEGEATGHCHRLSGGTILDFEDGGTYAFLVEIESLTHEEHARLEIPAGVWKVTRQREYSPEAVRFVAD